MHRLKSRGGEPSLAISFSKVFFFRVFGREKLKNDVFEKSAPARVLRGESSLARFRKNVVFRVFGFEKLKNDVFEKSAHALPHMHWLVKNLEALHGSGSATPKSDILAKPVD